MDEYNYDLDVDKELDEVLGEEEDEEFNQITHRNIQNRNTQLRVAPIEVGTRTQLMVEQTKAEVDKYYAFIKEKTGLDPGFIEYTNFELGNDNKTLFLKVGTESIQITAKRGGGFISLVTLRGRIGDGGVNAIKDLLSLSDYKAATKTLSAQAVASLQNVENNLPDVDTMEITDLPNAAETLVKEIETSFIENVSIGEGTQTDMTKREMDGILKAMTTVKEEIANSLAHLAETNKDLAKENTKLEQAKSEQDNFQIDRISKRIRDLEIERSAILEVININRDKLRSQVNRIKETVTKILNEDTTLGERIKTLFKEQGITIVTVLTAFGLLIDVIVNAFIPTTGAITPKPSPKPNGSDVKDWIKKQLSNLGKLLANLAGKAAVALPGIIGSVVAWLLSSTGSVVGWFAEHLWAVVVLVAGLLYAAAREFIRNKRN